MVKHLAESVPGSHDIPSRSVLVAFFTTKRLRERIKYGKRWTDAINFFMPIQVDLIGARSGFFDPSLSPSSSRNPGCRKVHGNENQTAFHDYRFPSRNRPGGLQSDRPTGEPCHSIVYSGVSGALSTAAITPESD
jgi:hypothetical protein